MKKTENTVLWWVGWIVLTIASFFVSSGFWTGWIARHVGPMGQKNAAILWVTAVFGSWMALLIPLIIVMYSKVDKAYEDARLAREKTTLDKSMVESPIRRFLIDKKMRRLNPVLVSKIKTLPEAIKNGHLVNARLKNGREIKNLFVYNQSDVLGVYGLDSINFDIGDIAEIEPSDLERLPAFETEKWWRFD